MSKVCIGVLLIASDWSASAYTAAASISIDVPDLNVATRDLGDERKYFVFHKQGVSFDAAHKDISFCSRYIMRGAQRRYPSFVSWQRKQAPKPIVESYNGLVGAAIGAIVAGPIDRSVRQSRMIRCMVPRGYARYRTSEAVWRRLNGEELEPSIDVQAKIASGPAPPTPRTLP